MTSSRAKRSTTASPTRRNWGLAEPREWLVTIFQAIPLIGWLGFAIFSMIALGSAVAKRFRDIDRLARPPGTRRADVAADAG